ncbi:sulfite exporter TauE/SafE family protein [Neisseriaceae bacterium B1]
MWTLNIIFALLAAGTFAGFLAGLLGVGGGTIIVPIVLWFLHKQGVDSPYTQHLALGTSFAIMMFTTISSALAQHRRGSIDWSIVRHLSPAMIVGSLLGAGLAKFLSADFLQWFFIGFLYVIAVQMVLKIKPKPTRQLPKPAGLFASGSVIGLLSSWVGIGGGSLSVPFMTYCNVPIHRAVGTSAALAWTMSIAGCVGYVFSGWQAQALPAHTFGFVYLPVVLILAACTMTFAPLGVKAAHGLSPDKLKMAMGILLFLIATQMLYKRLF